MRKSVINLSCLFIVLVILGIVGCAGGIRGNLKRVQQPTETELKQNWQKALLKFHPRI